jgi:hypothetical protein
VIGLTETYLKPDELGLIHQASLPGSSSDHNPCASRGGVANFYENKFQFTETK